jgi:hypothetical protein
MWAERALEAWTALERDAIGSARGGLRVLDGPNGRRAPLWPIAHVLWAAAEAVVVGGNPPIPELAAALQPYRSGDAFAATARGTRYFDDNAWLGLAMLRLAVATADPTWRERASELTRFIERGEHPDGGVRWAEGSESRNTCSTASGAWLLIAAATPDACRIGDRWMDWLDQTLLDPKGLYADRVEGDRVHDQHWTYNQGAALAARRLLGRTTDDLRDAILERWSPGQLWAEPPAFAAIAYRALQDEQPDRIDAVWDPYLERLAAEARDPNTGWYIRGGVGSYDGRPTIDQAAIVEMFALRSAH